MTTLEAAPAQVLYHSERGLHQFQAEGVAYCYSRLNNLPVWDTGIGKALAHGQRVATPSGWRTIESLIVGDEVFGSDGLPHQVVGVYPQGERPLYRVGFTDGVEVICDEDHLWAVNTRKRKWMGDPDKVMSLAEIMASGLRLSDGWKHYVPVADPVDYVAADLPVDPYTLGALIGDGGLTQPALRITTMDPDMIDLLVLPEGVVAKPQRAKSLATTWLLTSGRGVPNPLLSAIRDLGLACKSEFKRIPEIYLRASIEQRWALLQGLLDTDGYCGTSIEFYSSSVGLGEDVAELARSLGGTASITIKETGSLPCSVVRMVLPPERCPFRIQRKASLWHPRRRPTRAICSIEPVMAGLATCIAVDAPDSLFLTEGYVVTHNTHLAMATAALLFEDGLLDHMLVVCEKNKVDEWVADLAKFTSLTTAKYHGDPKKRAAIRANLPQVLVTTYETARDDATKWTKVPGRKIDKGRRLDPHVLTEALVGRRVLIAYDEISAKLGNRGSTTFRAHDLLVKELRKAQPEGTRTLGLTATPIERNVETTYNLGRILTPKTMPTVADFNDNYVKRFDQYGNPAEFKNLSPDNMEDFDVVPFKTLLAPVLLRKRKTDPDVVDQFPKTVEEISYVPLSQRQREFYDAVYDAFNDGRDEDDIVPGLWTTLRQIAGHPAALLHSEGIIARTIVEQVGEAGLRAIGSAKADRLVEYLQPLVLGQGAQAVVFSFFGPSILPLLKEALESGKNPIRCAMNHGQMGDAERAQQKAAFREGRYDVFLTSDAGARGINLPEATYAVEFEMALTHANRTQRLNRIHRIDSNAPSVTFQSFIASETVEEGIARGVMDRNRWSDTLLDDDDPGEHFMSAADRRALLRRAKRRLG